MHLNAKMRLTMLNQVDATRHERGEGREGLNLHDFGCRDVDDGSS